MEKEYGNCSDEELILRLRDGEEAITDYIMDKYKTWCAAKQNPCIFWGPTEKI